MSFRKIINWFFGSDVVQQVHHLFEPEPSFDSEPQDEVQSRRPEQGRRKSDPYKSALYRGLIHRTRFYKNNKGLTLLEVMVALVIFSVGFMCLLPMIVTAIKGNEFADAFTKASNYSNAKIEELKSSHSFITGAKCDTDTVENMQRIWTVAKQDTHYWQMIVKVSWQDHYGKAHQCSTITGESTTE